jgi:hypothetical protein
MGLHISRIFKIEMLEAQIDLNHFIMFLTVEIDVPSDSKRFLFFKKKSITITKFL